ncbi:hypothetical protein OIY81_2129 [Cryptosporidium canis]|nr:hypothetical protein OIY81_2129 [Cryptosporidium canis]
MQGQRNYAKQELIYDLLFGSNSKKSPKGAARRFGDSRECLICKRDKHFVAGHLGVDLPEAIAELLCIECKRGLFSFEGFRYQCKQVKNSVSNLESVGVVLSEQMRKLHHLISKDGALLASSRRTEQNKVPDWCNRDIPSKFGKGSLHVEEGVEQIRKGIVQEEESRLSDQLQLFHDDLLNLQETIFAFINVLEAYIDTPWVSVVRESSSRREAQPCVADLLGHNPAQPDKPQVYDHQNQEQNTTAQRIERIRKQQEKVRQQIKSLYDDASNDLSDNPGNLYSSSADTQADQKSRLANYFLFTQDALLSDQEDSPGRSQPNPAGEAEKAHQMLRNYDILWSPSSASASSNDDSN